MRGLSGVALSGWCVDQQVSSYSTEQHTRPQTEVGISVVTRRARVCPLWSWVHRCSAAVVARPGLVGSPSSPPEECCFCPWLAPSWHCQPICKPSPTSSTYKSTSLSQRPPIRPRDNVDARRDGHQMCACQSDQTRPGVSLFLRL